MKSFYTCFKHQLSFNHVVTACEFMYPDVLTKYSNGNNTRHFNSWRSISTLACLVFKNGFSEAGVLKMIRTFEDNYKIFIKNKGELLKCSYSDIQDLESLCVENDYGILSSNDFYYPKYGKIVSINGNPIEGTVVLIKQAN